MQDGKPAGFFVVEAREGWPRYTEGQSIELLTWNARNQYGQMIREAAAYAPWNYWARHGVIALVAVCATFVGCLGLRPRPKPSEGPPPK
jgi:hypothetical protein